MSENNYPQEEIDAMMDFYDGKKCVISLLTGSTQWSHILDAALQPSNERVSISHLILCDGAEHTLA